MRKTLVFTFLFALTGAAQAAEIGGNIDATLTLTADSELTGDVTCTVSGAPCIVLNAPNITLRLNAFTITGLGDPQTGCGGNATANEFGILVNNQDGVTIEGPGLVQQFRNTGVQLTTSTHTTVRGITTATNCASGLLVAGGSDNELERNVSIRNGNGASACGGI